MHSINLKKKSDAIIAMKHYEAYVRIQQQKTIKRWHFDAGGEFKSSQVTEWLKESGIIIKTSVPHQHQQNRYLLASWWEFTMNHAIHLINHTPIKQLDWKTPLEVGSETVPDFTEYKVFRCATYVYLPEEVHSNKMGPKSELLTYISYDSGTKGYKFMHVSNTVFIGAMATFDENLFPHCPIAHTPCITNSDEEQPEDSGDHSHEFCYSCHEWFTQSNGMDNLFSLSLIQTSIPFFLACFHSTHAQCYCILLSPFPTFSLLADNKVPLAI